MSEKRLRQAKDVFGDNVVDKALTRIPTLEEFPRYVLEYLISNYCDEETFYEDVQQVKRKIQENYARPSEADLIKHKIKQSGKYPIIANLDVQLVATDDKYWARIPAIKENRIWIDEALLKQYQRLLGGMWGIVELGYDNTLIHNRAIRPFIVLSFVPFQVVRIDMDEFLEARSAFSTAEWMDILMNTFGLNPDKYSRREKLLFLLRAVPLVEEHLNFLELGPRETGKTYLMRNTSYYSHVISGGRTSPAKLFVNLANNEVGLVGKFDTVIFDEIANTSFVDPETTLSVLKDYMQSGQFSRGKNAIPGIASVCMMGNIDVQGRLPHEKYYHLFEPLPLMLQDTALLDRIHAYLPGWELPKISPESYAQDYGFVTDYFCEVMHLLRSRDALSSVEQRFRLFDVKGNPHGISGRDERAIFKVLSGFLKLLHPDGNVTDEELKEYLLVAIEARQRVKDQLNKMSPGEFPEIQIGAELTKTGEIIVPELLERSRTVRIRIPKKLNPGEVIGLALSGEIGLIQRFEVVAVKGNGRLLPLGSMLRVMKESLKTAYEYVSANAASLQIDPAFRKNYDISVLAVPTATPKEGPSSGLALLIGLVSALRKVPVSPDVAVAGEITLLGKVLSVSGITQKLVAATDAGINTVILPKENEPDLFVVPDTIRNKLNIVMVEQIDEALEAIFNAKTDEVGEFIKNLDKPTYDMLL
ncbi:MAG: BREX system Lon protease-like protein BrxL [Candidatus Poribacteria bacterium]